MPSGSVLAASVVLDVPGDEGLKRLKGQRFEALEANGRYPLLCPGIGEG